MLLQWGSAKSLVPLAAHLLYFTTSAQICSNLSPVVLDVTNITIGDGSIVRGARFQYGSPAQELALFPQLNTNETYLYDGTSTCTPTALCTADFGGAFVDSKSSTWQNIGLQDLHSFDNITDEYAYAGSDLLVVNSSLSERFTVLASRDISLNAIGLGPQSRMLAWLYNAGLIASKSASIFWGQTGILPANIHDGAIVMGGYDKAQTTGPNFTSGIRPIGTTNCVSGLVISLSDMRLSYPNGSKESLLPSTSQGQLLTYCIDPSFNIITMPLDNWEMWLGVEPQLYTDLSNSQDRAPSGPNTWGMLYTPGNMTTADLVLSIDNGIDVTIPNHQLAQAYYTYNTDGSMDVNETYRELMINPLLDVNKDDFPKLGRTFLQAAYLNVNYDTDEFTLWQAAAPGAAPIYVASSSSSNGCGTNNETNGTSTNGEGSHHKASALSKGAIGGIVAAAVVFLIIVVSLFWWYIRKTSDARGKSGSDTATPLQSVIADRDHKDGLNSHDGKDSTWSGMVPKPELDGQSWGELHHVGVRKAASERRFMVPQEMA